MKNNYPVALVILDGFGYRTQTAHNAIAQSPMPFFQKMLVTHPWTTLEASGTAVGLPKDTIGNSEVGHMTIGLGKAIQQPLTRINNAIQNGSFFTNTTLTHNLTRLAATGGTLHIMGLFSDTGVHSTLEHLYAYLQAAEHAHVTKIVIHAFLDGRDTAPQSAGLFLEQLSDYIKNHPNVSLGTIHGRSYAMDRDQQWARAKQTYELLTTPTTALCTWQDALHTTYHTNHTEEFLVPCAVSKDSFIQAGDGVIFFNIRPDRARQLTSLFLHDNKELNTKAIPLLFFITPVSYGSDYPTTVLFQEEKKPQSLIDILDAQGYSTFSIAETTKYAHITYFFNGGKEAQHAQETRVLIPSHAPNAIDTYPCMQAAKITDAVIHSLTTKPCDFYLINYANADMVGHTGDFELTKASLTCLDAQLEKLHTTLVVEKKGIMIITGDHGNAEDMYDEETHQVRTAHTNNPVYFLVIDPHTQQNIKAMSQLQDIAPFIQKLVIKS